MTIVAYNIICGSIAHAAEFKAICGGDRCVVFLDRTGIRLGSVHIENTSVYRWRSYNSRELSPLQRSLKTLNGAAIGGLAGTAILGPFGAALGVVWGGSELSSGDAAVDLSFSIGGFNNEGVYSEINFSFENPDVARRFRMQLPMFTRLVAGEERELRTIQINFSEDIRLSLPAMP